MSTTDPTLTLLQLEHLTVDRTVQRPLDENRAQRMAQEFDMASFGVIHVSSRQDGSHHVVDGQHRVSAARLAGLESATVPGMVYVGLSKAEEAALFRRLNNTRQVQPIDKFRVRVEEGDMAAVQLNAMLRRHGWRVEHGKSRGAFAAVAAIEAIYNGARILADGPHLGACDTTIAVITAAWGHNGDGVRNELVSGIGSVVLRHGTAVDQRKMVAELSTFEGGPLGMVGNARTLRSISGGSITNAVAEIVTNLHNKGRRVNRLPEWRAA